MSALRQEVRTSTQIRAELDEVKAELKNLQNSSPVNVDHSALLQEFSALRQEVHMFTQLRAEFDEMRAKLDDASNKVRNLQKASVVPVAVPTSDSMVSDFPPLPSASVITAPDNVMSFAAFASELQECGVKEKPKAVKVRHPVIGRSTNSKLKSVVTTRDIDIFVSRLHPTSNEGDLQECVTDILGADYSDKTVCHKLKSKYEDLYASFHVCVKVNVCDFKNVFEVLNASGSWPEGALVRRYFRPKNV